MNIKQWNELARRSGRNGTIYPMAVLSLLVLSGCVTGPRVPEALRVPGGQEVLLHAYAKGVQIYVGERSATEPGQWVWKLKAPEAMLFEEDGNLIGSHYCGPTWEDDHDGSKVDGEVLHSCPASVPNAIPWLLVRAKSTEGPGLFNRVTYIQRVKTTGGNAPATAPDQAQVGEEIRVHYTAEYYFYRDAWSVPSLHALAAKSRKARPAADSTVLEGN